MAVDRRLHPRPPDGRTTQERVVKMVDALRSSPVYFIFYSTPYFHKALFLLHMTVL